MTARAFKLNLQAYLEGLLATTVLIEETNADRALPCVIISITGEQQTDAMPAHYTLEGEVVCAVQGRDDDEDNGTLETLSNAVLEALADESTLEAAMNKSVPDNRPATGFTLNKLFVEGAEVMHEDSSTFYVISFEAYTYAKDA